MSLRNIHLFILTVREYSSNPTSLPMPITSQIGNTTAQNSNTTAQIGNTTLEQWYYQINFSVKLEK